MPHKAETKSRSKSVGKCEKQKEPSGSAVKDEFVPCHWVRCEICDKGQWTPLSKQTVCSDCFFDEIIRSVPLNTSNPAPKHRDPLFVPISASMAKKWTEQMPEINEAPSTPRLYDTSSEEPSDCDLAQLCPPYDLFTYECAGCSNMINTLKQGKDLCDSCCGM